MINEGLHLHPTPAGAYHAVATRVPDRVASTLRYLLRQPASVPLKLETLKAAIDPPITSEQEVLNYFYHLQEMGLLQGTRQLYEPEYGNLEKALPELLAQITIDGQALLADDQGFYLGRHGFRHETAEELAGLSADVLTLHARHHGLLKGNMGLASSAWGLINAGGLGELGFWPLYVGESQFVLVVKSTPNLNHPAFLDLVWMLSLRYGD